MLEKKTIEHISNLARIELDDNEVEKFRGQLSDVLDYFEKLKEVDTEGVKVADGGTKDMFNVWREDEPFNFDSEGLLDMSPDNHMSQVKVKKILK